MKGMLFLISSVFILSGCLPSKEGKLSFGDIVVPKDRKPQSLEYTQNMQLGDRAFVTSVLTQVFDIRAGSPIELGIQYGVYKKIEFGGACDHYAISDLSYTQYEFESEFCTNGISIVQRSISNPMRFSHTTKMCEYLITLPETFRAIGKKIYADGLWKEPTKEKIKLAWELFHLLDPIEDDALEALLNIKNATTTNDEAWKVTLLAICSSPTWQAL